MKNIQKFLKLNNKKINDPIKNGAKILTDSSLKNIYRWQMRRWKDAPHPMLLGKFKWQQQWDTTTHLLECSKCKKKSGNAKCWWGCGEAETHSLLVGMQNGTALWNDFLQN